MKKIICIAIMMMVIIATARNSFALSFGEVETLGRVIIGENGDTYLIVNGPITNNGDMKVVGGNYYLDGELFVPVGETNAVTTYFVQRVEFADGIIIASTVITGVVSTISITNITFDADFVPDTSNAYDVGSALLPVRSIYAGDSLVVGTGTANGLYAVAEGQDTTASGDWSHAEGQDTTASEIHSHAEGNRTTASGGASHAEGYNTTASGYTSHAEGDSCVASGARSHAGGYFATASNDNAFVWSDGTVFASIIANSWSAYAANGYRFYGGGTADFDGDVSIDGNVNATTGSFTIVNANTAVITDLPYISDGADSLFFFGGSGSTLVKVIGIGPLACNNNSGANVIGIGQSSCNNNSGGDVNGLGIFTCNNNTGGDVNGLGTSACEDNSGTHVNGLGFFAASKNPYDYVNIIGKWSSVWSTNGTLGTEETWLSGDLHLYDPPSSGGVTTGTRLTFNGGEYITGSGGVIGVPFDLNVATNIIVGGTVDGIDIATDVGANTTHRGSAGTDHSDVGLNNTHRTSTGVDHTYIDQDVRTTASPTFASATIPFLTNATPVEVHTTAVAGDDIVSWDVLVAQIQLTQDINETYAEIGHRHIGAQLDVAVSTSTATLVTGLVVYADSGDMTVAIDGITTGTTGDYFVNLAASWGKTDAGTEIFNIHVFTNGVDTGIGLTRSISTQAAQGSGCGFGTLTNLPSETVITLHAWIDTGTDTMEIDHLALEVKRRK